MEHYYTKKPTSKFIIEEVKELILGKELNFKTGSGVFCVGSVDKGSKLLIEKCYMEKNWRVLDLGCGYGLVGISLAINFTENEFILTDVNERAAKLARMNAADYDLKNVKIFSGNTYEKVEGEFDTILLNPPQNAGRDLCIEMIKKGKDYLKKGGFMQIVVRHKKGGKYLSGIMEEIYGNMKDIAKKAGFRIYVSQKEE